MKFKSLLVMVVAGMFCLPLMSSGEDISAMLPRMREDAARGDVGVQKALGGIYMLGLGVAQDYTEAVKWYRLAADQGDASAQYKLGFTYAKMGNYAQAYAWLSVAAIQGDFLAEPYRDKVLLPKMTPEQFAEGKRLAREYSKMLLQ